MLIKLNKPLTEASIKYFLIQAFGSILLIISTTFTIIKAKEITIESLESLIFFSLILKAGVPPLHFWFPEIINKLNWTQCFILFTWQKIAPLLLIISIRLNKTISAATLAVILGAVGGLNQTTIKSLMAYSSISHRGWILTSAILNASIWLNYFLIYRLLSYSIIFTLTKAPIKKINEMHQWKENFINKAMLAFNILSLGGLPPFLGFMAKLSVITIMLASQFKYLLFIYVIASLLSLYFYFRLTYSFLINNQTTKKNKLHASINSRLSSLILCTATNIFIPLIIMIY